jgi:hypothetical protein
LINIAFLSVLIVKLILILWLFPSRSFSLCWNKAEITYLIEKKKKNYLTKYKRTVFPLGWSCPTGKRSERKVTRIVGKSTLAHSPHSQRFLFSVILRFMAVFYGFSSGKAILHERYVWLQRTEISIILIDYLPIERKLGIWGSPIKKEVGKSLLLRWGGRNFWYRLYPRFHFILTTECEARPQNYSTHLKIEEKN